MDGIVSKGIASEWVSPMKQMGFPYQDTKASLGMDCWGWPYMGFTEGPNLSDTIRYGSGNSEQFRVRVKFDEQSPKQTWFKHESGSNQIVVRNI